MRPALRRQFFILFVDEKLVELETSRALQGAAWAAHGAAEAAGGPGCRVWWVAHPRCLLAWLFVV